MRLLLDTHTFIWFVTNSSKLSISVKDLIEDENNAKLLSIASIWEMAIKQSTGKLSFSQPFQVFIQQQLSLNSIDILDININHLTVVASLPFHHRDPFDRFLISQAMVEQLPLLSIDSTFDSYPIGRL